MNPTEINELAQAVMGRLFVPIEASGRHVHVTKAQAHVLFGHELTPERPLSQPGQFLAKERLSIIGPKGEFHNVAVLGPERKETQIEISLTDGKTLGLVPPVHLSGQTVGTPGAVLSGPQGQVQVDQGVMAAQRHIHLSPEDGRRFGVTDKQVVRLQAFTGRPVVFEDVVVRIHPDFRAAVHLDYDEANACGFQKGDFGRILP
jgi:propanediol utilization protein